MARLLFRLSPFLLLIALPATSSAQASPPPVRRARELVALINTAQVAAVKAYVDSAFGGQMQGMPMEAHIGFVMGQHDESGGLTWVEATSVSPTSATAVVTGRLTGEPMAIGIRVAAEAPFRIEGIFRVPPPPAKTPARAIATDAALAAELGTYVGQLAAADVFSGAVLVARNRKVVFSKAYGQANKDFGTLNNLETRFNLGSMNKMFTSVAIAQLVEQGKVSYDDPLSKFLPNFPSPEAAKKIQVKHLLSHTSGLGSYFNDTFDQSSRARYKTVDQMMTLAQGDSLAFEPGSRWSYSNTGMLVLGKVIEVASGQDYFSYIREHVYRPAGMTRSDSYELDYVNANLAVGYEKEHQEDGTTRYHNNVFMHVIRGGPAGGGYSTVGDLLRFAEALKGGKLVSAATGIVGHSGGFPGISSNLDIFKGTGWVAVVQANYGGASQPVVEKIRALVTARGR